MLSKYTLFLLLGFYLQSVIYTLIITEEQRNAWGAKIMNRYYNECRHHMSHESDQLLLDDFSYDNEEIRWFKLCLLEKLHYIKNCKINVDLIIEDGGEFVKHSPIVELGARLLLNICKAEAEKFHEKLEVSATFVNCIDDRIQTDL